MLFGSHRIFDYAGGAPGTLPGATYTFVGSNSRSSQGNLTTPLGTQSGDIGILGVVDVLGQSTIIASPWDERITLTYGTSTITFKLYVRRLTGAETIQVNNQYNVSSWVLVYRPSSSISTLTSFGNRQITGSSTTIPSIALTTPVEYPSIILAISQAQNATPYDVNITNGNSSNVSKFNFPNTRLAVELVPVNEITDARTTNSYSGTSLQYGVAIMGLRAT